MSPWSESTDSAATTNHSHNSNTSTNKSPTVKKKKHHEHDLTLRQEIEALEELGQAPTVRANSY